MKKFLVGLVMVGVVALQGCIFTATEMVVNTATVVAVADQFDDIIVLIEENKSSFSEEDWRKLERSKTDLQGVAVMIQKTGVASVDQLKILRDAIKQVYIEVRDIVNVNLSNFSLLERIELLEFDRKMGVIDDMITTVENDPTTVNSERVVNMLLDLSKTVLIILPMVL